MVAGPNGLDLKKIQTRVKFKICFKFGLKIKKKSQWKIDCVFRAGSEKRSKRPARATASLTAELVREHACFWGGLL
jgi:hypothetical protein